MPVAVAGIPLLIANVDGTLLAYRDVCAGCGGTIHDGELESGTLTCRHCQRAFFLPRAGRSLDGDRIQLEPVPLLQERGPREGGAGGVSGDGASERRSRASQIGDAVAARRRAQMVSGLRGLTEAARACAGRRT